MTDYVKSTNFTAKDTLVSGDPLKKVKGTEIDVEFNAIATAISSKADAESPTFTGTPLAPTAAPGTNTTQLATTAFVNTAVDNFVVTTTDVQDLAITTAKIADDAVTSAKLADTGVTAGTYGSSTSIPSVTVNAQGQVTGVTTNAVNAFGASQTWQSVTRSLGTTYTNSTDKPIQVSVVISLGNGATTTLTVGGVQVAKFVGRDGAYIQNTYEQITMTAVVPPSTTYVASGGSLIAWTELR